MCKVLKASTSDFYTWIHKILSKRKNKKNCINTRKKSIEKKRKTTQKILKWANKISIKTMKKDSLILSFILIASINVFAQGGGIQKS